jgi:RNA polymerase sigma-70 factor (ECF subfamily)
MMAVCLRYAQDQQEAEDMLQESFIRIFKSLPQFRFEGSLEGWIRRITVHSALRVLQRKRIIFTAIEEDKLQRESMEADILSTLSAAEILKMICELPRGYRVVFNLYVMEGYDHKEIAQMLHIQPGTSRSQLQKARTILQTKIEQSQKLPHGFK